VSRRRISAAERPRPPSGARHLARGPRDGAPQALDRGRRHADAEAREADGCLRAAVGAEDRTADAHDPRRRLLLIDRVAATADRRKLGLQARERRDRVLRSRRELRGSLVKPFDLVVGEEREHRLPERRAVRGQPAPDVRRHVRLISALARILALDVDDVGVIEDRHLRREAGAARELAHRGPPDLADRELVEVRVAELRDAKVEAPAVPLGGRRDEAAVLEHLQEVRDARPRSAEQLRQLARGEAVLAALDEEHEHVEGPPGGASDGASLPHGARR
jgi:hypothetical protein